MQVRITVGLCSSDVMNLFPRNRNLEHINISGLLINSIRRLEKVNAGDEVCVFEINAFVFKYFHAYLIPCLCRGIAARPAVG